MLLVFLIIGTYGLFLIPYWIIVSIRNRKWGLLVPLVGVNMFWIIRAGVELIATRVAGSSIGLWVLFSIIATFMVGSSLMVGIAYLIINSLTTAFKR